MSKSMSMALNIQRRNRVKKMSNGGVVSDNSKKTVGEIIGYPGSTPVRKAHGGEIEAEPKSISEAIRRKRRMAEASEPSADEPLEPIMDDLNEEAGEEDPAEDEALKRRNRIAAIRKKNR